MSGDDLTVSEDGSKTGGSALCVDPDAKRVLIFASALG
jgi:hypothetical protein